MFNRISLINILVLRQTPINCLTNGHNLRYFSKGVEDFNEIKKCCDILKISYDFDANELRNGYLESCKRTHPDLRHENNDHNNNDNEFLVIENAYNKLKHYLNNKHKQKQQIEEIREEEEEIEIKHTVPQHRQYLNFDGIGFGTPTDRQKQYQKYRLMKATNRVNEMQINKVKNSSEHFHSPNTSIALKDPNLQREMKVKQGIDRLVEDLIQEAMAKGEFKNLPGYGKPFKFKPEYPYLDSATIKLNEILINNGFVPEWVVLEREIRDQRQQIVNELCLRKEQIDLNDLNKIFHLNQLFDEKVKDLNKKIDKYNRIVPILNKQQIHLNIKKELKKLKETDPKISNNESNINRNSNSDFNSKQNNLKLENRIDVNNCEDRVKSGENLFKKILSLFS